MEVKLSNRARGAIKHVKELEDLQMKMEVKVFITLAHTVEMEVVDMGVKTFARGKKVLDKETNMEKEEEDKGGDQVHQTVGSDQKGRQRRRR